MRLDSFIAQLQEIQAREGGDLPVVCFNAKEEFGFVQAIEVAQAKDFQQPYIGGVNAEQLSSGSLYVEIVGVS